ncbi:MAG: low temperature requirement protein A [Acidimicrobiales bacterium]|nr:low temperature requirement protein A [Acidimicrobiales bacterium]
MSDTDHDTKRTSYLELFFDLVFVFAITQLASALHADHSASGWAHAALLAWLVWWAWSQYTWAGNAIDLDRRPVQLAVLGVTGVALLAAAAIPAAFGDTGLRFAVPYVAVRLAGLALYWAGLRHDRAHQAALRTFLPIAVISPVLVLVGGAAPGSVRPWVWLAAVAVDVVSALNAGRGEFRVSPAHFAERHALIVIIALGESVIAAGAALSDLDPSPARTATTVAGFAVVATLWWAYFGWVSKATERRLAATPDHRQRAHLARDLYTFGHLPIVTGVIVFAVGVEEALLHPTDPLDAFGRAAIAGGLALFLVGFVLGNARATHTLLVERAVGAVAIVAFVAVGGRHLAAAVVLTAVALALVAITAREAHRQLRAGAARG